MKDLSYYSEHLDEIYDLDIITGGPTIFGENVSSKELLSIFKLLFDNHKPIYMLEYRYPEQFEGTHRVFGTSYQHLYEIAKKALPDSIYYCASFNMHLWKMEYTGANDFLLGYEPSYTYMEYQQFPTENDGNGSHRLS